MHDREIVAAIEAGDSAGLAAAYDRYAQGLFFYCQSLLTEPADAADAVQNTFIIAAAKVSELRDPERLRAWLYAVARNECHGRLRARALSAPLDEAAETSDDTDDLGAAAEQAELRALVRAALSGLNPGEREVIELNLRHELDGADLADVLGVPRNQAHALASRARSQFETSLGVLLVARTGREFCPDLAAILEGWDGELTVLIRKRVNRHIEHCEVCGERRRRELNPTMLLGLLPVALASTSLREDVLRLAADTTPGSLAHHAQVVHSAGPFGSSGFPPQASPPHVSLTPRLGHAGRAAVATAAAAAVLAGALLVLRHHVGPPTAAGPQPGSSGAPGAPGAGAGPHASAPGAQPGTGSGSGTSPGRPGSSSPPGSRLAGASAQPAPTVAGPVWRWPRSSRPRPSRPRAPRPRPPAGQRPSRPCSRPRWPRRAR